MRTFILFIRRFFNLILFLGVEVVCIIMIARTKTLQGNDIVSSANVVSGLLYKKQNDVVYYFGLGRMNDSLLNENARLRLQMAMLKGIDTLHDSLVHKPIGKPDSTHVVRYADYVYRTARVINNSVSAANNYITINRGSNDGITRNMSVLSGSGTVGRVVHVSPHFASILSVLSVKQQVSARLKDGTYGYVTWDGDRPDVLMMRDVAQQIKVKAGDTVYTTSYSFFPPDIVMGYVFKTETLKKNNLQLLYMHPAANFRNLQYVYVVENKMDAERKELEDSVKSK
ncbi:MAG: rod shape-determining protein MreC [Flavipsychrobacter sp.]|nr:rod shape-determining protein MreC [Flavipsychrobacter sp.]